MRVDVTPATQITFNIGAPTLGLRPGFHLLNIRWRDSNGRFSTHITRPFIKLPESAEPNRLITELEYWSANDYANAVWVSTPTQNNLEFQTPVSLQNFSDGMHALNIRFRDNGGLWSVPVVQFIYKIPTGKKATREIEALQYWAGSNFASAVTVNLAPNQNLVLLDSLRLQNLRTGLNPLNIRFRDNGGLWSTPMVRFIYKIPPDIKANRNIEAYQFWFGSNHKDAITVNLTNPQNIVLIDSIDLRKKSVGMHLLNIRYKDDGGLWSTPMSQFIYRLPTTYGLDSNKVTGYRYWVDNNMNNGATVNLQTPATELILLEGVDLTMAARGNRRIQFQYRDARGLWSAVTSHTFIKTSLPIANFAYTLIQHCDSTVVSFTDRSVDSDRVLWNFGDGRTSTLRNPRHTFQTAGTYRVSLTVTDTIIRRDSTLIRNIVVPVRKVDTGVREEGIVLTANASNATFQWVDCNNNYRPIPGQIGRSFTATVNGRFAVEVTQGGCVALSACFAIITVDVPDVDFAEKIRLFPNPNTGQFTIDLGEKKREVWITIFDQYGRNVAETHSDYGRELNLNLDLKPGIYFARIIANGKLETIRFVVR